MKKMKVKILLLLFLFFVIKNIFSQDYFPGYVVKYNNDTVKGYIKDYFWNISPRSVTFKKDKNSKKITYNINKIRSFYVNDRLYVSIKSKFLIANPIVVRNILQSDSIFYRKASGFAEILVKGPKNLLYFKDSFGREHFLISVKDSVQELIYYIYTNDEQKIFSKKKYIGQLKIYFKDCPEIFHYIENTQYKKYSLQKLFKRYYECKNENDIFYAKIPKYVVHFGAGLGAEYSKTKFFSDSKNFLYLTQVHFDDNYAPTLNVNFEIISNKPLKNQFSIFNELSAGSFRTYANYDGGYRKDSIVISYKYGALLSTILINHKFNSNSQIFFMFGIKQILKFSFINYDKVVYTTLTKEIEPFNSRQYEQAYLAGAGLKYKKFLFKFYYAVGNGLTYNLGLKSKTYNYNFSLSYYLF